MQPWMPPWGSQPPISPPPRHCCSGTHHCQMWRATSWSSLPVQVCWGSTSAHLHLTPIPKFKAQGVPSTEGTKALAESSSWQVAGMSSLPKCQLFQCFSSAGPMAHVPIKPWTMAVHTGGDWGHPTLLTGPAVAAQYPSYRNCVCGTLSETHY